MMNLFRRWRKKPKTTTIRRRVRPSLELLEGRDCPSAPTGSTSIAIAADSYSIVHNHTLAVTASQGVLANDSSGSGDPLSVIGNTSPDNGYLTMNSDGSFSYSPNMNFVGTDSFSYTASDGTSSSTGSVTINVTNQAPVANNDTAGILQNGLLSGNVLANDSDPDGDPLTATLGQGPSNGTVVVQPNGDFTYTPNANFVGTDSFFYHVSDGFTESAAQVTLNVAMSAQPRAVVPASEGTQFTELLTSFTVSDPGAVVTNYSASVDWGDGSAPSAGDITQTAASSFDVDGTHTYDAPGSYTIRVTISDNLGNTIVAQTTASVANVAPQNVSAGPDQTVNEGSTANFTGSFSDPGSKTETYTYSWSVYNSSGQQVGGGSTLNFNYTPPDDGTYTVYFTVTDSNGGSGTATTTLTANNVPPVLTLSGADSVNEMATYTLNLSSYDPGADTISQWSINWGDGTGAHVISGNPSSVSYVYDVPGSYTITATATDEDGTWAAGNSQTVSVINVKPVLTINHYMEDEKWVNVYGQVTDGQPGGLTVTLSGSINTTITTNPDGSFSVSVKADSLGNYTATVTDPGGLTSDPVTDTLTSNAPAITDFTAYHETGNTWTFSGYVTDESPYELVVQLGGLTSLQGKTATVGTDGSFYLTIDLQPNEQGTATAQVADWWGLESNVAQICVENYSY